MRKRTILRDDSGAALLEYTVLISVMLAGAISAMVLVAPWVEREWIGLEDGLACTLPDKAVPCVPPGHDK